MASNSLMRWLLVVPSAVVGFISVAGLYWLFHHLLLRICPSQLQAIEGTTDLSRPDFAAISPSCSASWYPAAEASLLVGMLLLAILVSATLAYRLAPSHKRLVGTLSVVVAGAVIAGAFLWPEP